MKVYGWVSWRKECSPAPNGSRQTREIMAAKSVAEVMRKTGIGRGELTHYGGWTHNEEEIKIATAQPGTVFWQPLNDKAGWKS